MKFTLYNAQQGHAEYAGMWQKMKALLMAGHKLTVEVKKQTRSSRQNARMWAMLTEVSNQVEWYGNRLTPEEWKAVLTASLKRQKTVPGIDGGFVVLGARTSKMTVEEMTELMDLIEAFGAQQGVRFSAPEWMEEDK